jgi:hypothetical protein
VVKGVANKCNKFYLYFFSLFCRLSAGKENALLAFCQVNDHEGVVISSPSLGDTSGSLQEQVMHNFRRCVAQIHAGFATRSDVKVGFLLYSTFHQFHFCVVCFVCLLFFKENQGIELN